MTRVVYLLGAGRCGSSVLGAMLGAAPDAVFVGELRHGGTEACRCGETPCPVWSRVGDPAATAWRDGVAAGPLALRWGRANDQDVGLIASLARAAGATWVVDSSRTPARLARLARVLPVLPIWLTRSPSGVLSSATSRPGARRQPGRSVARVLAWDLWSTVQCRAAAARFGALHMRWEDVAADPVAAAIRVRDAGGPDATAAAARLRDGHALPVGHPRVANRALDGATFRWNPPPVPPSLPAARIAALWR